MLPVCWHPHPRISMLRRGASSHDSEDDNFDTMLTTYASAKINIDIWGQEGGGIQHTGKMLPATVGIRIIDLSDLVVV